MCHSSDTNQERPGSYTKDGHLVGMLDRDQRTAKFVTTATYETVCHSRRSRRYSENRGAKLSHVFPRTLSNLSGNARKNAYVRKSLQRLKQLLVVGVYLLSIVSIPKSISAPIDGMASEQAREFWINPCDYRSEDMENRPVEAVSSSERDLGKICRQARIDLSYADDFKNNYLQSLQIDVDNYQKFSYSWFPNKEELHIDTEGKIADEHLASLTIDDFVVRIYHYLQKFGAGIELIINDQQARNGGFLKDFLETRNYLKSLLCEIQEFMINHNITQKPDVSRDLIPKDVQMSDTTGTTIRDWIIFRDYVTTLQYIVSAAEYLEKKS